MKKSTLRLTVVSACVGAGLVLAGCGGGADEAAGADTAAEEQGGSDEAAAEEAPAEAEPATEEDLIAAVEAGGFTAEPADGADLTDAGAGLADMTVEPEECGTLMNAAGEGAADSITAMVAGMPADSSSFTYGAAIAYPTADEALAHAASASDSLDACSDITMTLEGTEVAASVTEVDVEVDGADEILATEAEMDMGGQPMTTTTVFAVKGSALVSVTGTEMPGAGEAPSVVELGATAADMVAALP